jgi:hypothetical protein
VSFSILLNVIALPHHRSVDWEAAERRISELHIDDLQPYFRYWDPDGGLEEEARADFPDSVEQVRQELRDDLADVRRAVEAEHPDVRTFDLVEVRFFAAGGGSVGEVPSDLYDHFSSLESVGLLSAAGFSIVLVDTGPSDEELALLGVT